MQAPERCYRRGAAIRRALPAEREKAGRAGALARASRPAGRTADPQEPKARGGDRGADRGLSLITPVARCYGYRGISKRH
jgi:hypothetical protein